VSVEAYIALDFGTVDELIALQAAALGDKPAIIMDEEVLSYAGLDALMDRVAAGLQAQGLGQGDTVAIGALNSISNAAVFLGSVRAGVAVAPLSPSSTPQALAGMIADCGAKIVFVDKEVGASLQAAGVDLGIPQVSLDGSSYGQTLESWLPPEGAKPTPVEHKPTDPFSVIYSSGTTGAPKGIVQPLSMRFGQFKRGNYDPTSVSLISTPIYSNTTLTSFMPTIGLGGTMVMMKKFDVVRFLELSERYRVTDAMLVPVQHRRILEHPDFDKYDLSSYRMKYSTSAPFAAKLKEEELRRWPGGITEYYGMTEGGATCILYAHLHPTKLHTVGQPAEGHDVRMIDEDGVELPRGEIGEIVGRSPVIMTGYHNLPEKTAEAEWWSPAGERFIRTGDVGRYDEDGFVQLMDRKKDMIISGGFNIYPADIEAVIAKHPEVVEASVIGVPSDAWGETPVAYVALKEGSAVSADELRKWVNADVGKTQRLTDLKFIDKLPRSAIGKVLKRELRDAYAAALTAA